MNIYNNCIIIVYYNIQIKWSSLHRFNKLGVPRSTIANVKRRNLDSGIDRSHSGRQNQENIVVFVICYMDVLLGKEIVFSFGILSPINTHDLWPWVFGIST